MLNKNVIVITGGAGLIGKELVRAVVRHNGIAIIADINEENGIRAQDQLRKELDSSNIDFVALDTSSKTSLSGLIDLLDQRYGRIDALVNNAYPRNQNYGRGFFEVEYIDFCENLNLNVGGYFLASQQLAKYFHKQGRGNIVNIASIYGVIAPKFEVYKNTHMTMPVEYAAIKSAVIHLTKYMSKYFKGMNIRVNAISPGGIFDEQPADFVAAYKTNCLNKGMLGQSDINGSVIYLLSDMSLFVNGQNIIVDDGFSL